ncbi:MAG: Bax inhibitor-1/YccA family protein, partial [Gemmataceae bacterium]|nr:Bax inhibitor-1/YccA family protein [Gemmataceae bacterium]
MSIRTAPKANSSNPAFAFSALKRGRTDVVPTGESRAEAVTIEGTALKTLILVGLLVASAATVWLTLMPTAVKGAAIHPALVPVLLTGVFGGLVVALVAIFNPRTSPVTAPLYAVFEGIVIGAISAIFEYQFPGIVFQATGATIGVFAAILLLYGTGVIKVTETFKAVLFSAMLAICFVYLATLVLNLFGTTIPYLHGTGPVGIGFSVIVCIIAALSFAWDFQNVVDAKNAEAPR